MSDENASPNINYKSTPPTNRKIRNPFDKVLIENLHKPICSPGMCKIYKKQRNGSFRWDIDQACNLAPTDIVACNSQFAPSPDPAMEKIAEEATAKFFAQDMVMPSPLKSSNDTKPIQSHETRDKVSTRDFSAQTILTLPPILPPELELVLQKYYTFTQDQILSGEYEITANDSLRRKLTFEDHSDAEHYDSEQTDDEIHAENRTPSSYDKHSPVVFSPNLCQGLAAKGMLRTFGTPLDKAGQTSKSGYRNKILDLEDADDPCYSPIQFPTPRRNQFVSGTLPSSTVLSSPVTKAEFIDEEKINCTPTRVSKLASCLDCVSANKENKKWMCFCKTTPPLIRSSSLKDSPRVQRKSILCGKRSVSMSSLNRSRSVQKLDFGADMSLDESMNDKTPDVSMRSHVGLGSGTDFAQNPECSWSMEDDMSIYQLVQAEDSKERSRELDTLLFCKPDRINNKPYLVDEMPVKVKKKKDNNYFY